MTKPKKFIGHNIFYAHLHTNRFFFQSCDQAKFGYGLNMKVKCFKNTFIFWLHGRTCCRNLAI